MKRTIKSISDIVDIAVEVTDQFGTEPWWRGHSKAEYKLVPGVFRKNYKPGHEQSMAIEFKLSAPSRHPKVPENNDDPSWLLLMQHYGLRTRLLDWSLAPLTALYFAVCEYPEDNGKVWALNPLALNNQLFGEAALSHPGYSRAIPFFRQAFNKGEKSVTSPAMAIKPWELDPRMLMQQSAFTIHSSNQPLETLENHNQFLLDFGITVSAKEKIHNELSVLGIRISSLFPDLQNLSKEINSQYD